MTPRLCSNWDTHLPAWRYRLDDGQTAVLQAHLCLGCHLRTCCHPLSLVFVSHCTASLALLLACANMTITGTSAIVKSWLLLRCFCRVMSTSLESSSSSGGICFSINKYYSVYRQFSTGSISCLFSWSLKLPNTLKGGAWKWQHGCPQCPHLVFYLLPHPSIPLPLRLCIKCIVQSLAVSMHIYSDLNGCRGEGGGNRKERWW